MRKKKCSVGNVSAATWVEDSIHGLDVRTASLSSSHITAGISRSRVLAVFAAAAFFIAVILSRVIYLQIVHSGLYLARAEGNRQRVIPVASERGLVYDRELRPLTQNIPNFSLAVVPQDLPRDNDEFRSVMERLAGILGLQVQDVEDNVSRYRAYTHESIDIAEDISYENALSLMIYADELPGVYVRQGSKRLYLFPLSHILGYLGKLNPEDLEDLYARGYYPSDSAGTSGIEKVYERELRGQYGKKRVEVNSRGKVQQVLAEEQGIPGQHLLLNVDSVLQGELERLMRFHMRRGGFTRGAAVALDPRDGGVLALVSIPSYDNNDFSGGIDADTYRDYTQDIDRPLFNRAVAGTYPSGSTVKPALAAVALQERVITENSTIASTGGVRVGAWFFPDWLSGGHGATNVRKALAQSVNTFFYYIGGGYGDFDGLGIERLRNGLYRFGFGEDTGVDATGENAGLVPSPEWKQSLKGEPWYIGDTYNLSIGQGDLLVTPLQIANMTSAMANGGTLFVPHILQAFVNPRNGEKRYIPPQVIRGAAADAGNVNIVRQGMRDCVEYGSCRRLSGLPFAAAGKTGTAQWSSLKEPHAWFTSFAPYDNPEIALTIIVEEGGQGSATAVPIAYDFYKWWWEYRLKALHRPIL